MPAPAHAGEVHKFDGNKVKGCPLDGKAYTCGNLPSTNWDDSMSIATGYSVHVKSNVSPGWDYGLTMSGSARLTSSGSIDLSQINPAKISIAGGSFDAVGAFTIGGPIRVKADISAGSLTLGTGPEFHITGNMVSRGAVSIAYSVTLDGSVSGTSITTNSSVKISGSVTASGDVWIGSSTTIGGRVSGASIATDSSVTINSAVEARNVLTIGSHSTIRGAISGATSITLNSPVTIVGAVTSKGPVAIGSHANIEGAIKGTVLTTDSPVTLKGDIDATSRFTLASGSTVNGNITSPEVDMYAASSVVTGKVTASTYLTMGSAVRINGDVDTGQLKLEASETIINGNAAVDFATLFWHGRVSQKITCKKGTRPGYCDCVDNQSDYAVNTANGPRCEAAKPAAGALDHFLISHDGSGSVCAPETVTVTACADASCSATFKGGAQVKLTPGGAAADTGATGSVKAAVSTSTVGSVALGLTSGGTTPVRCYNSTTKTNLCEMTFAGAGFKITASPFKAGESRSATIEALEQDKNNNACVAKFENQTKDVEYSCGYLRPNAGSESLGVTANSSSALACTPGKTQTLATKFNDKGIATVTLAYEDAGELSLTAKSGELKGDTSFDVAPYKFGFELPAMPIRAGDSFNVTVSALSKNDKLTQNFNKDSLPAKATETAFSIICAYPANASKGQLTVEAVEFSKGRSTAAMSWNEVGKFQLRAAMTSSFLNTGVTTEGSTTGVDPCASVGPFIPKYFLVEQVNQVRKPLDFFYAGEAIPIRVTAMNAANKATENYSAGIVSQGVTLSAFGKDGSTANPNGGVLEPAPIAANTFAKGVALAKPAYGSLPDASGKRFPLAPGVVRLRADNADKTVSSKGDVTYEKATPEIRSGRLRVASVFGRLGAPLKLPVTVEYWSGKSWLLNDKDSFTIVPKASIAQSPQAHANGNGIAPTPQVFTGDLALKDGKADLPMQGNAAGWIDLAFNLGLSGAQDQSCLASHPPTNPANLPWLRSLGGCIDPSGRATFGIFAPESKRVIHVREVFD